jgi:SlyX protein
VTARQADTIDRLERRVALLVAREAERAAAEGGGVVIGDERPPHW